MELDSKFMKKAILLISFAIVLMWALDNIMIVISFLNRGISILSPFILGLAIAFIFKGPMNFFEEKIPWHKTKLNKYHGLKRGTSYLVTLIIFILIFLLISFIIIPELINTFMDITDRSPLIIGRVQEFITSVIEDNPQLMEWASFIEFDWDKLKTDTIEFTKNSIISVLESTLNFSISIVSGTITFALAYVFSIYVLFQKEQLIGQIKNLVLAIFPKKVSYRLFYIGNLSNKAFSGFLHGQLLEVMILAVMFFVAMTIFKFPYPLMISVTIGVSSIIPIFGSFFGCFIGAFLILVIDPKMALWFVIMFIIIQQIEGNLIYPQVVGKVSGLPSLWTLVAVTLGGSLMGILGIILFIPIFSILYILIGEFVENRLKEKNILE